MRVAWMRPRQSYLQTTGADGLIERQTAASASHTSARAVKMVDACSSCRRALHTTALVSQREAETSSLPEKRHEDLSSHHHAHLQVWPML